MDLEAQRSAAGEQAAQLVQDGMVIGYGTGRAATAALEALARRKIRVRGVPTSEKTAQTCRRLGLPLVTLEDYPRLDLVIDGADEVDPRRQLLKGGGGAHTREKLIALAASRVVIVVEEVKLVERLGSTRGIPVEILAFGWTGTLERVAKLLPGAARREGPPSDNGGVLLDAPMPPGADPREVARALKATAGVVEHGLFLDFSPTVIVGGPSGARMLSGG
jgi:ribose 5-phosphate isomerase A